jgi:hypothetical protein
MCYNIIYVPIQILLNNFEIQSDLEHEISTLIFVQQNSYMLNRIDPTQIIHIGFHKFCKTCLSIMAADFVLKGD